MLNISILKKCFVISLVLTSLPAMAQFGGPAPILSPDISSNGDVVLSINAPGADSVALSSSGDIPVVPFGGGLEMTKGEDGIWSIQLDNLDPGAYRYNFTVDGVTVLDPSSRSVSESNGKAWSVFYVPGADYMDTNKVEHGAIAEIQYYSDTLERHRQMHVYTPPGYELGAKDFPVFYLLHGAGDSDDSWSTVGRAGFILDNLIASGSAKAMIVVMPDGHLAAPGRQGDGMQLEGFAEEFKADIKPYIESHYRVLKDRANTAIAGLSMGGAQTLEIVANSLGDYAHVGVFSSGVFSITQDNSFQDKYKTTLNDSALKNGLNTVWFATGSDDFLLDTTLATVQMLKEHDFDVVYNQSTGGHTWINWREYLNQFAPMLFQ